MPNISNELIHEMNKISIEAYNDEKSLVTSLLQHIQLSKSQLNKIYNEACSYAEIIRKSTRYSIENFIQEYSLSTEEGIAVMCLAEALSRIPDSRTAKDLIEDKLQNKDWKKHLGQSDSLFVNASSWGLFLTGKIVNFNASEFSLNKVLAKISEPVLLVAIKKAINLMSNEFIMGQSIEEGRNNAKSYESKGYRFSYDILGESSRNKAQADFYYHEYINALNEIGKSSIHNANIYDQPSISIKLSALHPRFELLKIDRVDSELLPRVKDIVKKC